MKFYTVVGILFAADMVILVFWTILDPLRKKRLKFSLLEPQAGSKEDVMFVPVLEYCESKHQEVWTGNYYLIKVTIQFI